MNLTELKTRDIKELRELASKYGIKTHHKQKPETVANLIAEHIQQKPKEALQHKAEKQNTKELIVQTEAQVLEIIKPFLAKEGFEVIFPGDNTWWFKCKGSEDSGHMSCSPYNIRLKAEVVSRGARKPSMVNLGDGPIMGVG